MKRAVIPVLAVIGLLILIGGGIVAAIYIDRYMPTKEEADIASLLDVSGEETAIFYNDSLMSAKALTREGQAYLPIKWVNAYLNEKFYWDNVEKLLVYTLPETIVYADKRTVGSNNKPLLLVEEDDIYLSVNLVSTYTDVRTELFNDGTANRVYLNNEWNVRQIGTVSKETTVRVKGGIKSPIMTKVPAGGHFVVLDTGETWSKVRTADGYIGYMQNKRIAGIESQPQISTFIEPEYTSISLDEKVCLVWHQVFEDSGIRELEEQISRARGVNVIAPTWLMLTDNNGNYDSLASREYVDRAHALGLQVWATLDNFNRGSNVNSAILFAKTSARQSLIQKLMADVESYDLDGINLDIEGISQEAMPHYVQFIRELSIECRKNHVILSVDNYVPTEYTAAYNRAEQGRVVDYVIIMGYDEHYTGGEPGSVASLPFVEGGIRDTLAEVPAEKVINAVPFYSRRWVTESGQTTSAALGLAAQQNWINDNNVQLYWQEELGQYYGELRTGTSLETIWVEDERSLEIKMGLIEKYGLAGVACWKLGLDTESIWDVVSMSE